MSFETDAVHAGQFDDNGARAVVNPIYLTTTFARNEIGVIPNGGFLYSRLDNPNRRGLEKKLAALEGGADALAFSSGMAAMMAICHALLEPGAHVILPDDCYHGIAHLVKKMYAPWQVQFTEVDMLFPEQVEKAITAKTKLIIIETPSNPLLKISDIRSICKIATGHQVATVVDNTWATPYIQRPFELGANFVLHSTTKYFGGHSDIIGGCIVVKELNAASNKLREYQMIGGAVPSPFDCWLLDRSISTMPLRMKEQVKNAELIAEYLSNHPKIERVFYPGLVTHKNHEVAKEQMNSFGGMLSILVKGGREQAMAVANGLNIFKHATSLGGVESLIEHRRSVEGEHAKSPDNLLRLSIGVELVDDLINDLKQALESV